MIHDILKILDTTNLPELEKQRITTDLLRLFNVVNRSEQLVCFKCGNDDSDGRQIRSVEICEWCEG